MLLLIGVLTDANDDDSGAATATVGKTQQQAATDQQAAAVEQPAVKQWTAIATLSGNGDKKGPTFELTGAEARIRYGIKGEMSMLGIYVVEAGTDVMQTGGFPEVMQEGAGEGESSLHGKRGSYYLNVMGPNGNWQVVVEELR